MLKSWGVADLDSCDENEVISLECSWPQPPKTMPTARAQGRATAAIQGVEDVGPVVSGVRSIFMAGSWFPRLRGVARARSDRRQAPGDRPVRSRGSYAPHPENPTGWQPRVCMRIH